MKKFWSIFGVTLATLTLVVFVIVPHHHHNNDVPCFGFEVCDNHDNGCTDNHNHRDCEHCPSVSSYMVSESSHADHRCKVDGCAGDDLELHFHVPVFITGALIDLVPLDDGTPIKYNNYVPSSIDKVVVGSLNLRAPPVA